MDPRIVNTQRLDLELVVWIFEHVVLGLDFEAVEHTLHDNLVCLNILICQLLDKTICLLSLFVEDLDLFVIKLSHAFMLLIQYGLEVRNPLLGL